ncbi:MULTISPECIES: 30S ribosome-binding factor RbfA [Jeotgalicoccus]|jgi:ribosome-binding factor A|uniref:Ribosome-binding factor A n=1 Tax=Jeotgalicoccus nanhaiensis TaxID=568603 RepID=A0ABR9XV70_9STAP|nr:30S ribosome-binding factor RbfA [Jeotgalicoccus nanhaiensis]MBF0752666.1 30S ribosome-binding factor RbfA [Jeotgalicoccus nanhaiensis]TFU62839.1 30S ribosome-binding factor RbfA [Jeotgalicoccus nanhaiensis]
MSTRNERIAEEIKKVLSEEIRTTVTEKEPDIGMVTITEVEVTKENETATAYYTSLNNNREFVQETLDKFNGLFRKAVATNIRLRKAPEVKFKYDTSIDYGQKIESLLSDIKERDDK